VSLEATSYYHCYVRCVRRAFLCGEDSVSGVNYDHRKQWLVSRIRFLSYVYAIDVCAYAVMSNHYHVVLHIDRDRALSWSKKEVCERWMQLYKGHMLVDKWLESPKSLDPAMQDRVDEIIESWRHRLYDLGWFMRGINERIARMANEEENCKGRFWEGRFKSQALLDEAALLSCMAYVDLNPVRAAISSNLEESDYTSIQQRIMEYGQERVRNQPAVTQIETDDNGDKAKSQKKGKAPDSLVLKRVKKRIDAQQAIKQKMEDVKDLPAAPLMTFDGSAHVDVHSALPFTREDYIALVDDTGRCIREDKRGFISSSSHAVFLSQLGIDPDQWLEHIQNFSKVYAHCVGSPDNLRNFAQIFERKTAKGVGKVLYY